MGPQAPKNLDPRLREESLPREQRECFGYDDKVKTGNFWIGTSQV